MTGDEMTFDAAGVILGKIRAPGYPYNFVANPRSRKGRTVNANKYGRYGTRRGDNDYLRASLTEVSKLVETDSLW
jgi:hypothetical protein